MKPEDIEFIMHLFELQGFEEYEFVCNLQNPKMFCIELECTDMYSRWVTSCTNLFEHLIQTRTKYVSIEPIETATTSISRLRITISRNVDLFIKLSMEKRIETIKHELEALSSILDISNIVDALSVVHFADGATVLDFNENGLVNYDVSNCRTIEFHDDGILLFGYSEESVGKPKLFYHNAFLSNITVIAGLNENVKIDLLGQLINVGGGNKSDYDAGKIHIINFSHFDSCIKVDRKDWVSMTSHKFLILKKDKVLLNNGMLIIIPLTNVRNILLMKEVYKGV